MTEQNKPPTPPTPNLSPRQEKRQTEKQKRLAKAREMHEDWLEDGGSLDFISNMGCRNHMLALATEMGTPGLFECAVLVTQNRQQVGLKPLDPFKLLFDGTLSERSVQSESEVEDQIIENKAKAEKEALRKKRVNAAGGRISARN